MDYIMDAFNLPNLPTPVSGWGQTLRRRLHWADYMLAQQEFMLRERLKALPANNIRPIIVKRVRIKRKLREVAALRLRIDYYAFQLTGAPVNITGDWDE